MNRIRPKLVGIVGGSGSGKTWLAERLCALLGNNTQRLALDAFYMDRSHLPESRRSSINYDHPRAIDWSLVENVLGMARAGRPVAAPCYDFASHSRLNCAQALHPAPVLLVEGLWLLRRPSVRRLFDLTVFVDCPSGQRLAWRLARDRAERARSEESVRRQFRETVALMHKLFVATQKAHADLVLRQPMDSSAVDQLFDRLWLLMASDAISSERRREAVRAKFQKALTTGGL